MRKLVAALAVRNDGSRLFGKPMQNLDYKTGYTILEYIIDEIKSFGIVDEIVLGISEGVNNFGYKDFCKQRNLKFILGDEIDVLSRLISCAELVNATDVFRVTSESPFLFGEQVAQAWELHKSNKNDLTLIDEVPDGCAFEFISLQALKASHLDGEDRHRSELCSLFIRENSSRFGIQQMDIPEDLKRSDLRLTVDFPEDLVVCRRVYQNFKEKAPNIPLKDIICYLDNNPELKNLVSPFIS